MSQSEAMIQKGILDYLTMISKQMPLYFFRAGSGAVKTMQGRYFKTGRPGVPDIVVCWAGKFVGLEVKAPKGRQSQAQKKAEQEIASAKGEYHIVRSVSDVKAIIEND